MLNPAPDNCFVPQSTQESLSFKKKKNKKFTSEMFRISDDFNVSLRVEKPVRKVCISQIVLNELAHAQ